MRRCPSPGSRWTRTSSRESMIIRVRSVRTASLNCSTEIADSVDDARRRARIVCRLTSIPSLSALLMERLRRSKKMGSGTSSPAWRSSNSFRVSRMDVVVFPAPTSPSSAHS